MDAPQAHIPRMVPLISDENDIVSYGSSFICQVDAVTGALQQVHTGGEYIGGYGQAVSSQGTTFTGTIGGSLSTISAVDENNTVLWQHSYPYQLPDHQTVAAIIESGDVLVQRLMPTKILQLRDGLTGVVRWEVNDLQWPIVSETTIFAGSQNSPEVVALDLSGNELWRTSVGTGNAAYADFLTTSGIVVRSGATVTLLSVDGQISWQHTSDADISVPASLTGTGELFFGNVNGLATRLDTCLNYSEGPWVVSRHANERHTGYAGAVTSSIVECPTNAPPTAVVSGDMSVRVGDSIMLSGVESFDDNTPLTSLTFSWSAVDGLGNPVSLIASTSVTPTLVASELGTYLVSLIVTDAEGAQSTPASLVVSTENLAPTANAGMQQIVLVGESVILLGSAVDPEGDALTPTWTLSLPAGSSAILADSSALETSFVADVEGQYVARLDVSDIIGPGQPDSVDIQALSASGFVSVQIAKASDAIELLDDSVIVGGHTQALQASLRSASRALRKSDSDKVRSSLERALIRTDGCVERDAVDVSGREVDWVLDCDSQIPIATLLLAAIAALN